MPTENHTNRRDTTGRRCIEAVREALEVVDAGHPFPVDDVIEQRQSAVPRVPPPNTSRELSRSY
ncbi:MULTISPECIES: hypothetical protein [Haloarcula]|uniref:hypothetical protein n=1 Tax=Haloarcula TaxID=2237 RepID=UPI001666E4EF|nr:MULTISPECIES: hypothetical protein [Halomicroarcula]MBX0350337.1 hypothetical protein [Halomicroarcula pellucida]MDS0277561.1 hypothetical protein [Halomicroarcula sp. S1AR25-4]